MHDARAHRHRWWRNGRPPVPRNRRRTRVAAKTARRDRDVRGDLAWHREPSRAEGRLRARCPAKRRTEGHVDLVTSAWRVVAAAERDRRVDDRLTPGAT